MKYERRNQEMRKQYDTLLGCIKCLGENSCELYTTSEIDNTKKYCVWFETLLHDKNKLDTGGVLTFPNLENILNHVKDLPELKYFIKISETYKK